MAEQTASIPESARPAGRRFVVALAAALTVWLLLVGGLAYLLYSRTHWQRQSDQANLREWIDEARIFRKSLPEQVAEYIDLRQRYGLSEDEGLVVRKRQEIAEQLKRLADPTRIYQGQIPLFPDIYRLEVNFPATEWRAIAWDSPLPRPRPQLKATNELTYPLFGTNDQRAVVRCEYRLHAYDVRQREVQETQRLLPLLLGAAAVGVLGTGLWIYVGMEQLWTRQQAEHADDQARLYREELNRKTLEQSLETARQEARAADAERATFELKSQIFASIGITAGSYAHNIKNLLVRPNDLLSRCLESDGLTPKQQVMLGEIRGTLGTVTERLQDILRTVRSDPSRSDPARLDVNGLIQSMVGTWAELARDKWKLMLTSEATPDDLWIQGDRSHLVQALENLLFNARDATFEMRGHIREQARVRSDGDGEVRRQALLLAAGWKGQVVFRTRLDNGNAVVEVEDNGIGMTDEVQRRCVETHFTTKRDNAVFEGFNAGMGLGLSFVTMVLERHNGRLEIESRPLAGATVRAIIPIAATAGHSPGNER